MGKSGKAHPYKKNEKTDEKKVEAFVVETDQPKINQPLRPGTHLRMGQVSLIPTENEILMNGRKIVLIPTEDVHGIMQSLEAVLSSTVQMGLRPVNVCVRDFLMENVKIIPASWKKHSIFFPGSVFTAPGGEPCVPFIYWHCGWSWHNITLTSMKDVLGKNAVVAAV
ncbi:MAG: hypothetical protein WCO21_03015 [bacterium]